jgi:hypothetical protein
MSPSRTGAALLRDGGGEDMTPRHFRLFGALCAMESRENHEKNGVAAFRVGPGDLRRLR